MAQVEQIQALQAGQEQPTHPHLQGYLQSVLLVVEAGQDLRFLAAMEAQVDSPQAVAAVEEQLKLEQPLVLVA